LGDTTDETGENTNQGQDPRRSHGKASVLSEIRIEKKGERGRGLRTPLQKKNANFGNLPESACIRRGIKRRKFKKKGSERTGNRIG